MKNSLTVIALNLVLAVVLAAIISAPVEGDCSSGIKAVHLDKAAKAFVDDTTIEIDDTNGLQVKALPAGSLLPGNVNSIFGPWTDKDSENNTLVKDTVYKVSSDGFIFYNSNGSDNGGVEIFTDSNNPPTTSRWHTSQTTRYGGCCPVRKDDYVKIGAVHAGVIYWIPLGSGSCVKQ